MISTEAIYKCIWTIYYRMKNVTVYRLQDSLYIILSLTLIHSYSLS